MKKRGKEVYSIIIGIMVLFIASLISQYIPSVLIITSCAVWLWIIVKLAKRASRKRVKKRASPKIVEKRVNPKITEKREEFSREQILQNWNEAKLKYEQEKAEELAEQQRIRAERREKQRLEEERRERDLINAYAKIVKENDYADIPAYDNWGDMTGEKFERFCANLLKYNGFRQITTTKGSGDRGVDILAFNIVEHKNYAIQCKFYSQPVGNHAIQEIFSGKAIYGADIAVVITNNTFTRQAIEDAKSLNVLLWDNRELTKMVLIASKVKRELTYV